MMAEKYTFWTKGLPGEKTVSGKKYYKWGKTTRFDKNPKGSTTYAQKAELSSNSLWKMLSNRGLKLR